MRARSPIQLGCGRYCDMSASVLSVLLQWTASDPSRGSPEGPVRPPRSERESLPCTVDQLLGDAIFRFTHKNAYISRFSDLLYAPIFLWDGWSLHGN